jgi:voltage-gated potassium channel Kch
MFWLFVSLRWVFGRFGLAKKPGLFFLLIILAAATLYLGTVGFHEDGQQLKRTWGTSFFHAAGFLTLNNFNLDVKSAWLDWARTCGAAFFFLSTFSVAWSYLGNLILCSILNRHIVVIGIGWRGRRILEELVRKSPWTQIAVVDPKIDDAFKDWCTAHSVAVVVGDAVEQEILKAARIDRAKTIYLFSEEDRTNIQIASTAAHLCKVKKGSAGWRANQAIKTLQTEQAALRNCRDEGKKEALRKRIAEVEPPAEASAKAALKEMVHCHMELKSQRAFEAMNRAINQGETRLRPEMVNVEALTGRALLARYPIDRFDYKTTATVSHVVVLGAGSMAREIMRQAIQQGHFEAAEDYPGATTRRLLLTVLVPDPTEFARQIRTFYPAYTNVVHENGSHILTSGYEWVRDENVLPTICVRGLPAHSASFFSVNSVLESALFPKELAGEGPLFSIYVAVDHGDYNLGMARAMCAYLHRLGRKHKVQEDMALYFYVTPANVAYCDQVTRGFYREDTGDGPYVIVRPFEDFLGNYEECCLKDTEIDHLAKLMHWMYLNPAHVVSLVETPGRRPLRKMEIPALALRDWYNSPEESKDSNRQAAAHGLGKSIISDRLGGKDDPAKRRALARIEHRRWCADILLKGYRPLVPPLQPGGPPTPSDPDRKRTNREVVRSWFGLKDVVSIKRRWKAEGRHVHLVPYSAITEIIALAEVDDQDALAERELAKDEDQIRVVLPYWGEAELPYSNRKLMREPHLL